jgi:hemolysin D
VVKLNNATIPLTPGINVAVEISTDSRRVLDYLLSPLAKIGSEALRKR